MKNNTAVVSSMLSLTLWKNSPENYFSLVSYLEFSGAALQKLDRSLAAGFIETTVYGTEKYCLAFLYSALWMWLVIVSCL